MASMVAIFYVELTLTTGVMVTLLLFVWLHDDCVSTRPSSQATATYLVLHVILLISSDKTGY